LLLFRPTAARGMRVKVSVMRRRLPAFAAASEAPVAWVEAAATLKTSGGQP